MSDKSIKKKHTISLQKRNGIYGCLFLLPWMIGVLMFFLIPVVQSVYYSLSTSSPLEPREISLFAYIKETFVGFSHYEYMWNEQPDFTNNLSKAISTFLYSMPIIIALSLIFAIILNQNFRGRLLARAIFFLPVIIATGVVLNYLSGDVSAQEMLSSGESGSTMYNSLSFSSLLANIGLPDSLIHQMDSYINSIFDLIWSCGIQTLLFLAGLQSIPASCYEVAEVEGATSWETFWFVTIPMMMNVILLNMVFTAIELFTKESNAVMVQAYEFIMQAEYNYGSAIIWSCCAVFGVIICIIFFLMSRLVRRYDS